MDLNHLINYVGKYQKQYSKKSKHHQLGKGTDFKEDKKWLNSIAAKVWIEIYLINKFLFKKIIKLIFTLHYHI